MSTIRACAGAYCPRLSADSAPISLTNQRTHSDRVRISLGNKGTTFILVRPNARAE